MKGKTIIELKDVKTGAVQRVEHGNTFQSAVISHLFKTYGALNINFLANHKNNNELWKTLVGGLLIFDDTIETGTWYPPQDVNMVGNASYNVLNSGDPVEMGSWNESESYVTKDEIVMTYDFTTSQANGSIASVALTSAEGGFIGVGNSSGTYHSSYGSHLLIADDAVIPAKVLSTFNNAHLFDGEYFYEAVKSGTTLTIYKRYTNSAGVDLIKGYSSADDYVDTYNIGLSNNYSSWQVINETKVVYWSDDGNTYKAVIVDVKTKNVSNVYTIPKMTGVLRAGFVNGIDTLEMWQRYNDDNEFHIAIYDCVTDTWISDVDGTSLLNANGIMGGVSKVGIRYYYFREQAGISMCESDGVLVPLNGRDNGNTNRTATWRGHLGLWQLTTAYDQSTICNSNIYLATINNLDEPVVKDNTKTMKITYVLTRR